VRKPSKRRRSVGKQNANVWRRRKNVASVSHRFSVGDHVAWNSEAGRVSGTVIKVHTQDVDYKGYTHHASPHDPQYEIRSDKTDHVAMHKGSALTKLAR
jgi:hypothetical protein